MVRKQIRDVSAALGVPVKVTAETQTARLIRYQVVPIARKTANGNGGIVTKASILRKRVAEDFPAHGIPAVGLSRDRDGRLWVDVIRPDPLPVGLANIVSPQDQTIPFVLGLGVDNSGLAVDLADAPHILVAGSTGSGKSTCLHTALAHLLQTKTSSELYLVLIDPKHVEFARYTGIKHLMMPVLTELPDIKAALAKLCEIMDTRYTRGRKNVPPIAVFIDEFADLVIQDREIESLIVRLAQKGRGARIHLVMATQRPSADVVTGLITVNFPVRVCFQVPTKVHSRVILDQSGGEMLLGKGDGLLLKTGRVARFQGAYVPPDELEHIISLARPLVRPQRVEARPPRKVRRRRKWGLVEAILVLAIGGPVLCGLLAVLVALLGGGP